MIKRRRRCNGDCWSSGSSGLLMPDFEVGSRQKSPLSHLIQARSCCLGHLGHPEEFHNLATHSTRRVLLIGSCASGLGRSRVERSCSCGHYHECIQEAHLHGFSASGSMCTGSSSPSAAHLRTLNRSHGRKTLNVNNQSLVVRFGRACLHALTTVCELCYSTKECVHLLLCTVLTEHPVMLIQQTMCTSERLLVGSPPEALVVHGDASDKVVSSAVNL